MKFVKDAPLSEEDNEYIASAIQLPPCNDSNFLCQTSYPLLLAAIPYQIEHVPATWIVTELSELVYPDCHKNKNHRLVQIQILSSLLHRQKVNLTETNGNRIKEKGPCFFMVCKS